jgi:hypothetical protein
VRWAAAALPGYLGSLTAIEFVRVNQAYSGVN